MKPVPEDAPEALRALVGQPVTQIDTPAAVVDLDLMERNLALMASWCRIHDLRWRPHAKMHKCAALARLQMSAGAVGVCVQKVSEAAAMVARGVRDIYISNQVVAPAKLAQVASLARILQGTGGRLAIAVDSADGVSGLARALGSLENAIDVFVEIDVGQGRCGVPPGPAAWDLARLAWALHGHTNALTVPIGEFTDTGAGAVVVWDHDAASALFEALAADEPVPDAALNGQS